jgi:hypothetical protein
MDVLLRHVGTTQERCRVTALLGGVSTTAPLSGF